MRGLDIAHLNPALGRASSSKVLQLCLTWRSRQRRLFTMRCSPANTRCCLLYLAKGVFLLTQEDSSTRQRCDNATGRMDYLGKKQLQERRQRES